MSAPVPLTLNPPVLDAHADPDERVHELRLYAKRLRAMTQLLRPASRERDQLCALALEARDAARELAPGRDALVLHQTMLALAARARSDDNRRRLEALAGAFSPSAERVSPEQLVGLLARLEAVWMQLQSRAEGLGEEGCLRGLQRSYRRVLKLQSRVTRGDSPERFHRWRRWCKYLQYQLQMLGVSRSEPEYRNWAQLGRLLGERHDLHNALQALAGVGEGCDPLALSAARRLIGSRDARLRELSLALSAGLCDCPAEAFGEHWRARLMVS